MRIVGNGHAWAVLRCNDGLPFEAECSSVKKRDSFTIFELKGNVAHYVLMADRVTVLHDRSFYPALVKSLDPVFPHALLVVDFSVDS